MENEENVKSGQGTIKDIFKTWNFWKPVLGISIGALAGFLYYHFVGCASGTCAITSNPYMSTIWGGLLGLFVVKSPCSRGKC